jgi:hypothetical protein
MDLMKWRRVLVWLLPAAIFALCWAWATSSWGEMGLYVGWIPAMILGRLSGVLTSACLSIVALGVLLAWHFYASERREPDRSDLST